MKALLKGRTLILFSTLVAIAIASTSMAQITLVNQYTTHVNPITPPVHLVSGLSNTSALTESLNPTGSVAYVNLTQKFNLGGVTTSNLTGILKLPSTVPTNFTYLTNVTTFSGQARVNSVTLYSLAGNGSFFNDFTYNSTTGYTNGTSPVSVSTNQNSSLGLLINVGKSAFGGPYTWYLDFEVNGYASVGNNAPAVYTQYFVHIKVTTIELA